MKPVALATARRSRLAGVRGALRLASEGVDGVARIAEGLHASITQLAPPVGTQPRAQATRGITGLVYRSVRGGNRLVGGGLDLLLKTAEALLPAGADATRTDTEAGNALAIRSALNGTVGHHLERTHNPLAMPMELLVKGRPTPRLLLLIHGLCMNDEQWLRQGHDHGAALASALHVTPVYLRYNSGRHVSSNGADLAAALEQLLANWPTPVQSLTIVGHSMGGLLARSAVHQALLANLQWPQALRALVCLGTPHHGALLEQGGNWLQTGLGLSPYLAPFIRLTNLRSDGITDLRHGNLLQADWQGSRLGHRDARTAVPLPSGVACFAIAGTLASTTATGTTGKAALDRSLGDGLVTVDSALGRHRSRSHCLRFPASHTWIARGVNHIDLLSSAAVYARLRRWLAAPAV